MENYREGRWYIDGLLVYSVRPCTFGGQPHWENDTTIRIEATGRGGNVDRERQLAVRIMDFLNRKPLDTADRDTYDPSDNGNQGA